jgi:hypothetical protein
MPKRYKPWQEQPHTQQKHAILTAEVTIRFQFEGSLVKLLNNPALIGRNANFTDATRRISYLLRPLEHFRPCRNRPPIGRIW